MFLFVLCSNCSVGEATNVYSRIHWQIELGSVNKRTIHFNLLRFVVDPTGVSDISCNQFKRRQVVYQVPLNAT